MKYIWILLLGIMFLSACSNEDDSLSNNQFLNCETVLGWDEINNFFECDRINVEQEAKSVAIGEWRLRAWDCGFCNPNQVDTPSINVVLLENGEGTSMYRGVGSDDFEFTWTADLDTFGNIYIRTEPPVWYISGSLICTEYFGSSSRALDGPTFVYSKCD